MQLIVVTGRSGSGKSTALNVLEDEGFTCIDNLPISLLPALIDQVIDPEGIHNQQFAVGIDARNLNEDLGRISEIFAASKLSTNEFAVVYLDTSREQLLKRFSETRRRHPLSNNKTGLIEAIAKEKEILRPLAALANVTIDTSNLNVHELRSTIRKLVGNSDSKRVAVMFTSFGFKYGVPVDADFIFDVRCLPNPFWSPSLRLKTGLDPDVINFLQQQSEVDAMFNDISAFLLRWLPAFEQNNRSYVTVSIGCTGGMHRSVYLVERLANGLRSEYENVQTRHRQLTQIPGD